MYVWIEYDFIWINERLVKGKWNQQRLQSMGLFDSAWFLFTVKIDMFGHKFF